jgi:hypothetical protein
MPDEEITPRAIRDAALMILRREGHPQTTAGKTPNRITFVELASLRIAHNTPFTPQPAPSDSLSYALAQAGRLPQPYALDIWDDRKKTFSVSWSEGDAALRVTTFRKGPWINRLLSHVAQENTQGE